ncbi:DUF4097 family beta strand repeat-containing protein [Halobaculum sp. MBLA0147]|uniref:DUF4097 family beta strand repeat-containing protein n=1 Tax=Halobaculum sp. MBLA0147 TaxID=3079934 RepID=UPI0035235E90
MTRRRLLAGGAAAAVTALAGCSGATPFVGQRLEETTTLSVETLSAVTAEVQTGDVTVETADRDDVRLEIVRESSSADVDVSKLELRTERSDGTLSLRSEWTGGDTTFGGRPSMDLTLTVPDSLAVRHLESQTGDVTATDTSGDLRAETQTGDVDVDGVGGTVVAVAQTGDVSVTEPGALGGAETQTGDATVDVPALDGDCEVSCQTGDVDVAVSADLDADLVVETGTGDASVSGLDLVDATREDDRVTGRLGEGGPDLTVESQTGDATVEPL